MAPCLDLDIASATGPTSTFFTAGAGLRLPSVVSLGGLVETLLMPPSDRDPLGEPIPEPDLAPLPDGDRFTDEQWRQADTLLDLGEVPRRLSGLLAQARSTNPELPELVTLRGLHAVGPEVSTARQQGDQVVPLAVDDGAVLDDPEFGGRALTGTALFEAGRLSLELLRTYRVMLPLQVTSVGPERCSWWSRTATPSIRCAARCARHPTGSARWPGVPGAGFESSVLSVASMGPAVREIRYFGDLDAAGLRIPAAASRLAQREGLPAVQPATALKTTLLAVGRPRGAQLPSTRSVRTNSSAGSILSITSPAGCFSPRVTVSPRRRSAWPT